MPQAELPRGIVTSARRRVRADRAKKQAEGVEKNGNLGKKDWLNMALVVLNEEGVNGIKVLPLSKRLGVTRGSFYWHFEDRDELLREVLQHWDEELTGTVILHAKALDVSPREKLEDVLTNVLFNRREIYDAAIAAWGTFDDDVAKVYNRVVRKRLRYITSVLMDANISKSHAEFKARLIIGFMSSEVGGRSRRSRADHISDITRLCDIVFA